jgi:hypothetical protein
LPEAGRLLGQALIENSRRRLIGPKLCLLIVALTAASVPEALAQGAPAVSAHRQPSGQWQVDVFGSWSQSGRLPEGGGRLPADPPFVPLALVIPQQTQHVSSWFFGAGARLLASGGSSLPGTPSPGHALDQALLVRPIGPSSGPGGGATLVRRLSSRFKLEVTLEASRTGLDFGPRLRREAEASRKLFETFFDQATQVVGSESSAAASSTIDRGATALELRGSAGLRMVVTETPKRAVYVASGGGLSSATSDRRTMRFRGAYHFVSRGRFGAPSTHDESDSVDLRAIGNRLGPFGYVGAGFDRRISTRTGVHLEGRVIVRRVSGRILLSAFPHVITTSDSSILRSGIRAIVISEASSPVTSIVFNNNLELSREFPSSLSGAEIRDLEVFKGSDIHLSASVRFGLYYRF